MVILAGIALLFTVGEDGIIERTTQATKKSHESENEEKIELVISSYSIESYEGKSINYKKIVNEILDIFDYPNINEEDGTLLEGETGITDLYTMTAEEGLVNIVSKSQELLLRIKYNEEIKTIKIEYNNKIWEFENLKLKSKEKNTYVEYNAPEEIAGTEYKSGLWQYKKNESGTLTITQYLGTTAEELTDVAVPNRINGQIVEYFDGFGKNLTGTLTISKGLKTSGSSTSTRANVSANKLILEEDVVIQNNAFFNGSKLNIVEIKKNVILNAQQIFSWVNIDNMQIGKNVQILNNAFFWSKIKELNIEENCKIETTISNTQKIKIGDNAKININVTETLEELTIGNNAIMNGFSGATSLKNINIGENCSLRGKNLFADCSSITDNDVYNILKNSIEIQAFGLFSNCDSLVNVIIPANKTISRISKAGNERYMFQGCDNVNSLTIKENCIFNDATFYYCNFKNLIIEDNVKFVSGYAFGGSKELNNVKIGKNCLIKGMVFNYCSNIENVIIDVQTEGSGASFNGCTSIKNVEYYLTEEQKNLCKENLDNVNKIINSNAMFKTIINNNTLTATFEEDKIVLKKVES